MKTKIWISFRADGIPGEAATILTPTGCGPEVAEVSDYSMRGRRDIGVNIKLDEIDERVPKVLALLQHFGVEFESFTYTEYSEEDRQNARLLLACPASYNEDFITITFWSGTKYDVTNACPHCETGARQTSPVYLDKYDKKVIRKHRAVLASLSSLIVDGGIRKKLVDAGVTGISFGEVRLGHDEDKWSEVARDQVFATHTLPPMHGELTERDVQYLCKVCRRGGRHGILDKHYREDDLVGMQDFNLTWEWFGEFWPENKEKQLGRKRPTPRLLVTPKVMNILNKAGVKSFQWLPVNVVP